jgi:flagellar export protein FliJ
MAFYFSLQRVLDLRRRQLDVEETKLRSHAEAIAALDRERARLEASAISSELQVRERSALEGSDLEALGNFRLHIQRREAEISARRAGYQQRLEEQRKVVVEAQRRCRLLERLKERRQNEWQTSQDREIEAAATESYLARWSRERDE